MVAGSDKMRVIGASILSILYTRAFFELLVPTPLDEPAEEHKLREGNSKIAVTFKRTIPAR
jgi:hypothetical protein